MEVKKEERRRGREEEEEEGIYGGLVQTSGLWEVLLWLRGGFVGYHGNCVDGAGLARQLRRAIGEGGE